MKDSMDDKKAGWGSTVSGSGSNSLDAKNEGEKKASELCKNRYDKDNSNKQKWNIL